MSSATCASLASVRPARKTCAPSRAKAPATAPPIEPPPPVDHSVLAFEQHSVYLLSSVGLQRRPGEDLKLTVRAIVSISRRLGRFGPDCGSKGRGIARGRSTQSARLRAVTTNAREKTRPSFWSSVGDTGSLREGSSPVAVLDPSLIEGGAAIAQHGQVLKLGARRSDGKTLWADDPSCREELGVASAWLRLIAAINLCRHVGDCVRRR